jgi:hypothetical protein
LANNNDAAYRTFAVLLFTFLQQKI